MFVTLIQAVLLILLKGPWGIKVLVPVFRRLSKTDIDSSPLRITILDSIVYVLDAMICLSLHFYLVSQKNWEKIAELTNSKTLDSEDIEFMYLSDKNCSLSDRYAFPSTVGITGRDISPHWEFIDWFGWGKELQILPPEQSAEKKPDPGVFLIIILTI